MKKLSFKLIGLALIGLVLNFFVSGYADAASLFAECKVGNGRSTVAVRSLGIKGKFYVLVFSGEENNALSSPKRAIKNRVDFLFDSDPVFLADNPEPIAFKIEPKFILKREVAVVIRNAETNEHMGGIRIKCKKYRAVQQPGNPNAPRKSGWLSKIK